MGVRLGVLAWRHVTKAIFPRYHEKNQLVTQVVEWADGPPDDGEQQQAGIDPFDAMMHKQTAHGAKVEGAIYGRGIQQSPFSKPGERAGSRRVSQVWRGIFMFPSTMEGVAGGTGPGPLVDMMRAIRAEEEKCWRVLAKVDMGEQLQQVLGREARFRGVQEAALRAIMRQESPVVVVMGTGGGKSMLFMLPARCSSEMTVVVVPLLSLRNDIKMRCDELGIGCAEWSARRPEEWASLTLVTPESAVGPSFGNFIHRQRAMGRLGRIVVDECHTVMDSGVGGQWRSRMLGLRGLPRAEVQLVYLRATIRPTDEEEFGRLVRLPSRGARWFRGSTTRKNVRYTVRRYRIGKETEQEVLDTLVIRRYGTKGNQGSDHRVLRHGEEGGAVGRFDGGDMLSPQRGHGRGEEEVGGAVGRRQRASVHGNERIGVEGGRAAQPVVSVRGFGSGVT
jgi:hypothetical protein